FGNSTYSTGRLIACPSAPAMSAVTPRGLPSPSFTAKKMDFSGANTSATRSLPVGASSFTSSSRAAALSTSGRLNSTAVMILEASVLSMIPKKPAPDLIRGVQRFSEKIMLKQAGHDGLHCNPPLLIGNLGSLAQIGDQPLLGYPLRGLNLALWASRFAYHRTMAMPADTAAVIAGSAHWGGK